MIAVHLNCTLKLYHSRVMQQWINHFCKLQIMTASINSQGEKKSNSKDQERHKIFALSTWEDNSVAYTFTCGTTLWVLYLFSNFPQPSSQSRTFEVPGRDFLGQFQTKLYGGSFHLSLLLSFLLFSICQSPLLLHSPLPLSSVSHSQSLIFPPFVLQSPLSVLMP